jgi:chromosome segregation ATPase
MIELLRYILRRLNIITHQEHQMSIIFENLNAQIAALQVQVDSLVANHGAVCAGLAETQAKLDAANSALGTTKAELDAAKADVVTAQTAVDASAAQIAALVAKLAAAVTPVAPVSPHVV